MGFEEFFEEMEKRLQEMLGRGCSLERQETLGINGSVKHSLAVSDREKTICPCVDMGQCYLTYQAGAGLEELAEQILEACGKEAPVTKEDVFRFMEWEFIKGHIFARLINTEKNEALLKEIPYRNYLDLSVVYYARIKGKSGEEAGIIQIRREHMEQWGVDEETLNRQAWKNLRDTNDAVVEYMSSVLHKYCGVESYPYTGRVEHEICVLGSRNRTYGAVHMCNREMLLGASLMCGGDFWILPSSIHEVILAPVVQGKFEAQDLAEIVREVNDTRVEQNEILSYHIYRYYKERGEVVLAV